MQRLRRRMGLLIGLLAFLLTLATVWYGQRYWRIASNSATAPARAVKVEREDQPGRNVIGAPYRYFASYEYVDAAGNSHSNRETISRDLYDTLAQHADTPLLVYFSRSKTELSILDLNAARAVPLLLGGLSTLMWCAAAAFYFRG